MANMWNKIKNLWNEENRLALFIAIVLILLFILTADNTPLWIYQGF